MGTATWVILVIAALILILVVWIISTYNNLVKRKNYQEEAWSGIQVFLKKRYDLVPNLLETVKGYAAHEKGIIEQVTVNRAMAMKAGAPGEKMQSEQRFSQSLGGLFAVAENYPDLKASANFRQFQSDLSLLETEIESARRYYNGAVRENNVLIESFPASMVAGAGKFRKGVFFEQEGNDYQQTPVISF
jgi:LemA protein